MEVRAYMCIYWVILRISRFGFSRDSLLYVHEWNIFKQIFVGKWITCCSYVLLCDILYSCSQLISLIENGKEIGSK